VTRKEAVNQAAERLNEAGLPDAGTDSRILFEYITGVTINELFLHPDAEISAEDEVRYGEAVDRRLTRMPVQHITGRQEFMGLEFTVSENVLIPRFDTEVLVEEAMRQGLSHMNILDMCTGSGCILLSLMHYSHDCTGTGVDISEEALKVARHNSEKLGIPVRLIRSDLFEGLDPKELKYDLIISNPPYIPSEVIPTLMEEVRDHEPVIALDGSPDGLIFYRRIVSGSPAFLHKGGMLMFEIGCDQADAVSGLMDEAGYEDIEVVKDLSGNDRVVSGRWPGEGPIQ